MSIVSTIPKSFTQGKTAAPLALPATEVTPTAKAGYMLLNWEEEERLRALETFENNPSPLVITAHNPNEVPLTVVAAPGQTGYLFQIYNAQGLISFFSQNGTFYSAEGTVLSGPPGGTPLIVSSGAPGTASGIIVQNAATYPYFSISNPQQNDAQITDSYGQVLIAGSAGASFTGVGLGQTGGQASVFNTATIVISATGNVFITKNTVALGALLINGQDTGTPHQYGWNSGTYGAGILSFADNTIGKNIYIVNSNGAFLMISPLTVANLFTVMNTAQSITLFSIQNPQAGDAWLSNQNGYVNITGSTGVLLGVPAPALTATSGLVYIQATAGAPTGVPSPFTGYAAMRYDTTDHKLWIYDGGWKGVVVA